MKKRLAALGLATLLVLSLFGCSAEPKEKAPIKEFIDNQSAQNGTFIAYGKEEEISRNPLTICIDAEYAERHSLYVDMTVVLNDFLLTLDQSGGLADVEILYIPKHGADRESILNRLRVEIMSGSGPDVFIMNTLGARTISMSYLEEKDRTDPLFRFPEQAMGNGLFLPLDDYMENNTRFTEWDKQTPVVLAAGRNEEGQQIIPLAYTLPVICYRKSDVDLDLTGADYTWNDMLTDPDLSPWASRLADCALLHPSVNDAYAEIRSYNMEHIIGDFADFEKEELCFTEEELLQCMKTILPVYSESLLEMKDPTNNVAYFEEDLGYGLIDNDKVQLSGIRTDEAKTMIPLYSMDGGVTATILSWAAINRNTRYSEEAYTVIDLLMREHVQRNYLIHEYVLRNQMGAGIPMHEELLHPNKPIGRDIKWSLTEENYQELCEVRSQITNVNFHNTLSIEIGDLFLKSIDAEGVQDYASVEQTVHEAYEKMQRMVRE